MRTHSYTGEILWRILYWGAPLQVEIWLRGQRSLIWPQTVKRKYAEEERGFANRSVAHDNDDPWPRTCHGSSFHTHTHISAHTDRTTFGRLVNFRLKATGSVPNSRR